VSFQLVGLGLMTGILRLISQTDASSLNCDRCHL